MMSLKTCSILWIVLCCFGFSSEVFGQNIQKKSIGERTYAVIHSEGLAGSAQWGAGVKMMRKGATIRHQVSNGNGGNLSVNDKIPLRFIVAPTDVAGVTWMQAEGVSDGNGNLDADFTREAVTGCRQYGSTKDGGGRSWRVPTQRELQLMWMFRVPIGIIYPDAKMVSVSEKNYWASTEKDANNAWAFDFKEGVPHCSWQLKTTSANVRCVSDY